MTNLEFEDRFKAVIRLHCEDVFIDKGTSFIGKQRMGRIARVRLNN